MANTITIKKGSGFFSIDNSIPGSVLYQESTNGDYPLNSARFIYYAESVVIKNIYTDVDIVSSLPYTTYINGTTEENFTNAEEFKAYVRQGFFTQPGGETPALAAPVLTAGTVGTTNIPLSWSTVTNALEYIVQRATNNSFTTGLEEVYSGPETEIDDTGLTSDTTYYYRVKASANGEGYVNSDWSNVISATTEESYSQIYNVGSGSGNLTINGNVDTYIDNSLILIAPGVYGTINIQNLNPATQITVKNGEGVVAMDGGNYEGGTSNIYAGLNYSNCSNLLISGDGSEDEYGFYIHDNSYRPTGISGAKNSNVTLQYFLYENIGDYPITLYGNETVWEGTDETIDNIDLKFISNKFDNCSGGINLNGVITETEVTDLNKGLEFGFNEWTNCNSGNMVFSGATDQMDIHDNVFTNLNATNNNDNGFFVIMGNANYYRNYANSYQGHAIRLFTLSFGTTPADCLIYDNINIGSRKYSPFEWQSTEGEVVKAAPNTTYCNIQLCNNTAGDLNYEEHSEFDACLVDNYEMPAGSTQEVFNNMLYNTYTSTSIAHRIFQFSNPTLEAQALADKNIYYTDDVAAGFNETTLTLDNGSPAKNAGLGGHLIDPLDYHFEPFNPTTPSIGAVS